MSGRFEKGAPRGPGRPKGSRNKASIWIDRLGQQDIETIIGVVKEKASKGNLQACNMVLQRTWPALRGRALALDLPAIADSKGLIDAQTELVALLSRGEVSADEASAISTLLENQRRAIEMHDLVQRLSVLEKKAAEKDKSKSSSEAELERLARIDEP